MFENKKKCFERCFDMLEEVIRMLSNIWEQASRNKHTLVGAGQGRSNIFDSVKSCELV